MGPLRHFQMLGVLIQLLKGNLNVGKYLRNGLATSAMLRVSTLFHYIHGRRGQSTMVKHLRSFNFGLLHTPYQLRKVVRTYQRNQNQIIVRPRANE